MELPIQVTFHGMAPSPALDAAIGGVDETFVTPTITEFIRSC